MKSKIHAIAGAIGSLAILTFWTSTAMSELFASDETIAAVKALILQGMFVLVVGMTNLVLMGLNIRDGLKMSGRISAT